MFNRFRPLTFTVTIDKQALLQSQTNPFSPVGIAYAYLHQRVALTIGRLYAGESAIFIADQQTAHEKYFHSGEMNKTREILSRGSTDHPNFNLIVDQPLWVDTELSSWDRELIQLADVVAYSSTECMRRGHAPDEASYLWSEIRKTLAIHMTTGKIGGRGFAVHPRTAAIPNLESH